MIPGEYLHTGIDEEEEKPAPSPCKDPELSYEEKNKLRATKEKSHFEASSTDEMVCSFGESKERDFEPESVETLQTSENLLQNYNEFIA